MPKLSSIFNIEAKRPPYFSMATAALMPLVIGISTLSGGDVQALAQPLFTGLYLGAAPLCAAMGGIGGFNLFKPERSKLSKVFSAAAAASTVVGLGMFAQTWNSGGWEALAAPIYPAMAMTAGGIANVIAHYTRDRRLQVQASLPPHEEKPVFKSTRTNKDDQQPKP